MIVEALELALASVAVAAGDGGPDPVAHVVNHPGPGALGWAWSAHVGTLLLAGIITCVGFWWVADKVATGPESEGAARYTTRNPIAHMIEVICIYLRDQVVEPLLHGRTNRFMPFLWTLFFFILINNLLGLIPILDIAFVLGELLGLGWKKAHVAPIGGTATQNLAVTGVLAFFAFVVINVAGIREMGIKEYLAHLTGGAPVYIWPILVPVEVLGIFIKPIALALRLFANMTAGHILLATLFAFIGLAVGLMDSIGGVAGAGLGVGVILVSTIGAFAVYLLELFVAFLQAFVFMFLTTVFISQLEHHGDHGHADDHAPDLATA